MQISSFAGLAKLYTLRHFQAVVRAFQVFPDTRMPITPWMNPLFTEALAPQGYTGYEFPIGRRDHRSASSAGAINGDQREHTSQHTTQIPTITYH